MARTRLARRLLIRDGMMRALVFAGLSIGIIVGCATDGSSPPRDQHQCDGLGCASFPGTLTLTVLDRTSQQPVPGTLTFTANGQPLPFVCSIDTTDACPSWKLSYEGAFDVEVAVAAYQPGTIHVKIDGPTGCCGQGADTSATLELDPL